MILYPVWCSHIRERNATLPPIKSGQNPVSRTGIPHDGRGSRANFPPYPFRPNRRRAGLPKCDALKPYEYRRETKTPCFECRECKAHFSITSGTLFASRKLPLRAYLAAIAIFCNEVKGNRRSHSHATCAFPTRPLSYCSTNSAKQWPLS